MTKPVLESLANFAVTAREKGFAAETEAATVKALIDWTSGAIVGAEEEASQLLTHALKSAITSYQQQDQGKGLVRLFTRPGAGSDPRTAALINGTAAHVSEIDDIYRDGLYHPGAPTIAAALAMGEYIQASGRALLRSIAIGYEIGCRVAREVNPSHYKYWHTTGTVGAIGSAAAAADLLELDNEQFKDALAQSVSMAAGLQQAFRSDSMTKPLHSGRAAEAGVLAALAAQSGFKGSSGIFDGEAGFTVAMGNGDATEEIFDGLGSSWAIEAITVKNHFCCGHTFAPIDGSLELVARGVVPEEIASIRVETYTVATEVAGIQSPRTAFEAKFSIPYTLATAMITGSVRERAFTPEALADSRVRKLIDLTEVIATSEKDANYPRQRSAKVIITMKSGQVFESDRKTRKGDPDDPMSEAEVSAKFLDLVEPRLGSERTQFLLSQLQNVKQIKDVRELAWAKVE